MSGHRHRFRQRNILPTSLGHKTRPKRVRGEIPFNPCQRTSLLHEGPHGSRGERFTQVPNFVRLNDLRESEAGRIQTIDLL